jgi:hypothetical protein
VYSKGKESEVQVMCRAGGQAGIQGKRGRGLGKTNSFIVGVQAV